MRKDDDITCNCLHSRRTERKTDNASARRKNSNSNSSRRAIYVALSYMVKYEACAAFAISLIDQGKTIAKGGKRWIAFSSHPYVPLQCFCHGENTHSLFHSPSPELEPLTPILLECRHYILSRRQGKGGNIPWICFQEEEKAQREYGGYAVLC